MGEVGIPLPDVDGVPVEPLRGIACLPRRDHVVEVAVAREDGGTDARDRLVGGVASGRDEPG
jgi:hypothetical protein